MERHSRPRRRRWWPWLGLGPIVPGLLLGCETTKPCHPDHCADIPKGAIPAPRGTYVHEFQKRQTIKAEVDDFVIYAHEWFKCGDRPGPYGQYHLDQIAKRLAEVPWPVLIQLVPNNDELNEARRKHVVLHLLNAGYPDAESRVVLGFPQPGGLYGDEAERVYEQMLQSQQNDLGNTGFGRNPFLGFGQSGFFTPGFVPFVGGGLGGGRR